MKLFHGTGIYCLASIVALNSLRNGCHWGKPGEPHGPRLSEEYGCAEQFINYNMYWGEGGLIVLDRDLLSKDYDLQAYADRLFTGEPMPNEREVAVITPAVESLDRYLVSVICDPAIIAQAHSREWMDIAMNEGGWPYECDEDGVQEAAADLRVLLTSPLLNKWMPDGISYPHQGNWDLGQISVEDADQHQAMCP